MGNRKSHYECGCVGYITTHNVFIRLTACDEHKHVQYCIRPNSKITSIEAID